MAIYYVDFTTGDDGDTGLSEALAWKTLTRVRAAQASLDAGDSVLFKCGETWSDDYLDITTGGSAVGGYITYGSYGTGVKPHFSISTSGDDVIVCSQMSAIDYVYIKDIQITKSGGSNGNAIIVTAYGSCYHSNWMVENVDVNSSINCAMVFANVNTLTVTGCTVASCNNGGIVLEGSAAYKVTNTTISNNTVHTGTGDGITLHNDGSDNGIGDNHTISGNTCYGWSEQGFDLDSFGGATNITYTGNTAYSNTIGGFLSQGDSTYITYDGNFSYNDGYTAFLCTGQDHITIKNNLIYNSPRVIVINAGPLTSGYTTPDYYYVYNNTIVGGAASAYGITVDKEVGGGTPNHLYFKGNIISGQAAYTRYLNSLTPASTGSEWDYNLYYGDGSLVAGQDAHSIGTDTDPLLVGGADWTEANQYKLQATSPAKDAATDLGVTTDYWGIARAQGAGYDMGAHEYSAGQFSLSAALGAYVLTGQAGNLAHSGVVTNKVGLRHSTIR